MFNLKNIQKTLSIISVVVFLVSFILMFFFAVTNPNGILGTLSVAKPISVLTTTTASSYSYGDTIQVSENVKITDSQTKIVSQDVTATLASPTSIKLDGVAYVQNTNPINLYLSSTINVDLNSGIYLISTNPIRITVLSGSAKWDEKNIAGANQTAIWAVDTFKTNTTNTNDLVISSKSLSLLKLLKNINLYPDQLSTLALDGTDITSIPVSETDTISGCESDLLTVHLLCDINKYRVENSLNTLSLDDQLNNLTLSHVVWMSENESTSTLNSEGLSYIERCSNQGFDCNSEINIKINSDYNELTIFNQLKENSHILNKGVSLIGLNVSGEYLSILLR